ncbi:Nucleic acid-binding, OB-fold [Cynara cardunculus var. scolymus]|uniref:Nucleic acid-binding, OB-fold n=1 Tax=Cynara cardunculus var. scolymus TaxID=59895 RepID=A0A118JY02_CYNCS|nr:Nucleic acid-binding, OB-fold [Cynara cardunculus var. scolymus]
MAAIMPTFSLRQLPWLNKFRSALSPPPPPLPYLRRSSSSMALPLDVSSAISSSSIEDSEEPKLDIDTFSTAIEEPNNRNKNRKTKPLFPKRGETLELVCESIAFKGKGLCKVEDTGYVVMCDRALPGERFIGRVTRKKNNYSEFDAVWALLEVQVTKLKTLSPHMDMVEAPCEYASHCGGCKTQSLLYEAQVRAKEDQVRDLVVHVGKFSFKDPEFDNVMKAIVPCDMQFHYRNKMEFSFGPKRWLPKEQLHERSEDANVYALGLHAPGFFDKVLAAVQDCWRNQELGLSPYDCHSHAGFLKHLMIRSGRDVETRLPQLMINFVTSSYKPELLKPLVDKLAVIPEVAEILYKLVEDSAGLKGDGSEIVLDLFCGTGTIGLTLAKKVKHVYGYEVVPEAISDARRNAKLNDPNRPGMHTNLIKYLLKLKAPRIVYVSCNPATCARDLDYLCHGSVEQKLQGCYRLRSVQPVDMFPHTPHIECVCLLELR